MKIQTRKINGYIDKKKEGVRKRVNDRKEGREGDKEERERGKMTKMEEGAGEKERDFVRARRDERRKKRGRYEEK